MIAPGATTPLQNAGLATGGLAGLDALATTLKWAFSGFGPPTDPEVMAIVLLSAPSLYLVASTINAALARLQRRVAAGEASREPAQ